MEIVTYQKKYEKDFIKLNIAWVEEYFVMEQADKEILEHVEDLLKIGSMIYFAVEDEHVFATCMIIPIGNDAWEICKFAANEKYKGRGAGSAVFKACMDYAIRHGAKKLTLVSNHILETALHIYEKFGFRQVELDSSGEYERADVQYEFICNGK